MLTYMPVLKWNVVRKSDFCLCENKGADQLCSNCEAVIEQAGLCQTWSKTPKTGFWHHGSYSLYFDVNIHTSVLAVREKCSNIFTIG